MNNSGLAGRDDTLNHILQLELENIRVFLELLELEQSMLAAGNIDDLALLTEDKNRVIDQFSKLDVRRNRLLTANGLPEGAKGIKAWLLVNHTDTTVARNWDELLDLAHLARQRNHTNAAIISTWLQHTRQTLSALHAVTGRGALYNPKGQIA